MNWTLWRAWHPVFTEDAGWVWAWPWHQVDVLWRYPDGVEMLPLTELPPAIYRLNMDNNNAIQ